jgi:hypothetical protein
VRTVAGIVQLNPATTTMMNDNLNKLFNRCEQLRGESCWNIAPPPEDARLRIITANTQPTLVTFRE